MNKKMSNSKKDKMNNIMIIAVAVLFVVLVAIIIFANGSERRKINKIFDNYTESVYGTNQDLSAQHYVGDDANYWVADNYVYYPEENIICDYTRITELNTSVTENINAYIEQLGEDYSMMTAQYYIYTDATDLDKEYAGLMIYYIGSKTDIFETSDDAAQFAWDLVEACGDVKLTGIDLNLFDSENEYYFSIDPFAGNTITLDALKENVQTTEEKSTLYALWQANLALADMQLESNADESDAADETVDEIAE